MKKILLETSLSKIYMIIMIIITLLILGGYFSYAMFTVTKEKSNAISIVTGNLEYNLLIDGEEGNTLSVPANSRKEFIVTLTNPNNRIARFNFYYKGDLQEGVDIGYIEENDYNTPPTETGINLEKVDSSGSSNIYIVRVSNITNSSITINLGVEVGLDYNDLTLPSDGHLLRKIITTGTVKEVIEDDIMNRLNYKDTEQTFVTGSNPNNYIWYSGKLWRAVSIDTSDNSVKLVTQWNISAIPYDNDSSSFEGSYMEEWLNDTTVDGFLGNLRNPESFIKMDSKWNASQMSDSSKPPSESEGGTIVEDAVGLLNLYEYNITRSYTEKYRFLLITPYDDSNIWTSYTYSVHNEVDASVSYGTKPSINLKSNVEIVAGDGTEENPYRLKGDNDTNLSGTKLNTRYSGEYITFGTGENNLYRIVSHETDGLTKVTSAHPLFENKTTKIMAFNSNTVNKYSIDTTIGGFLNGEYLDSDNYLTHEQVNMVEDNTTWYLGVVDSGQSYLLAKYSDTSMSNLTSNTTVAKVGLLRLGELMAAHYGRGSSYWALTPIGGFRQTRLIDANGYVNNYTVQSSFGIKPALNLKSNVIITGGDGTLQNPFVLALE